jgi:hypothetical protein
VRRTLALLAAAAVASLAAVIMGEYEPTIWTALATGVVLGAGLPEVVLGIVDWRGRVPACITGAFAAGSVVWAGWISSGRGLAPIRTTIWWAAAVAGVLGVLRLWGWERHRQEDLVTGDAGDGEHHDPTVV